MQLKNSETTVLITVQSKYPIDSSGTTDLPKSVELTHRNIVSNSAQFSFGIGTRCYSIFFTSLLYLRYLSFLSQPWQWRKNYNNVNAAFTSNDILKILEENRLSIIFYMTSSPVDVQIMNDLKNNT
ncbi:hypothetical protein HCN44_000781 [Aphidius gifuensis]|uniref:Uncharacterized protein n=1 Tax=Aphidius gifuensis TaxID=684658 RepID=A0A834XUE7_APHGI|nr:hypothetical protein HCN44_000781 [Aphidius gifuensis]